MLSCLGFQKPSSLGFITHFGLFSISLLASPPPWLLNVGIAPGFNSVPFSLLMTCSPQVTSCVFKAYRWINSQYIFLARISLLCSISILITCLPDMPTGVSHKLLAPGCFQMELVIFPSQGHLPQPFPREEMAPPSMQLLKQELESHP